MKKDNPDCPCCHIELVNVKYEGFAVHHCEKCKGYLVRSGRYISIKGKRERTEAALAQEGASEAAPDGSNRFCPHCKQKMMAKKPPGLGFQLDVCHDCEWTWFDGGELAKSQLAYEQMPATQGGATQGGNEVCTACGARFRLWASQNVGNPLRDAYDSYVSDDSYDSHNSYSHDSRAQSDYDRAGYTADDRTIDVCPSCGARRPSRPFWESITDWWQSFCKYG